MPNNDGEESIAQELAAQQQEISVAEFFERNRQMLGFGSEARALVTATKEGVDNAIDAAEEAMILPEISVRIEETDDGHYAFTVTDNGPGITKEQVPKIFGKLLYGSRFSARVQSRGQQGIGISAAVLYGQLTTGKPARITSKVAERDTAEYFEVAIDTDNNEPEIRTSNETEWEHDSDHGTSITIFLEGNFRARSRLHEYIEHTAIVNPHVTIELDEPNHYCKFDRTIDELPEQPTEIKPHPHGIEFGSLRSLIAATDSHTVSGFLQSDFTRVGQTTADEIIDAFIDRINGRYCRWIAPPPDAEIVIDSGGDPEQATLGNDPTDIETTTVQSHIAAHVNRKSEAATTAFASGIAETLHSTGVVAWPFVQQTVSETADDVEAEYDTTLGETVREKAAKAAWDVITTTRQQHLETQLDSWTSDKKTTDDVHAFAGTLARIIDEESDGTDAFQRSEVVNIVERTAKAVKSSISNPFGETAQDNIVNSLWSSMQQESGDPPLIRIINDDRDLADALHKAMRSVDVMAPPSHCLSPIGEDALVKGMKKVYDADFFTASQRDAESHSGDPFLVEAGIAYGGELEDGAVNLLRFANRVPLVYKKGACCITNVVTGIRWNNYKLSDKGGGLPQGPAAIVVHVASTNVPFTSESKDAIASVNIIEDEIERAVREAARDLKRYLKKKQSLQKRQQKQDVIAELLPEFSKKISAISGKQQPSVTHSLAQIMNNLLLMVEPGQDTDGNCSVTVANFDNQSSHTPTVTIKASSEPRANDAFTVEESVDGETWTVVWEPSVDAGVEESVPVGIPSSDIVSIDVTGVPAEKVTTSALATADS